jgi:tetratricopeptide (TPR) repeat protein
MSTSKFTYLFIALIVGLVLQLRAAGGSGSPRPGAPRIEIISAIEQNDVLIGGRHYGEALALMERTNALYPGSADVLWRLVAHMINDGDALKDKNEAKRESCYRRAVEYGEASVKADPANAHAHAYLAAAYGSVAMFEGGKEKVKLANTIRDELDAALKLDPRNSVAHTIYGTWQREVSEVGWVERRLANMFLGSLPEASLDESVRHFNAAILADPTVLRHRYELGLTYIAMDRDDLAARSFRAALKCPDLLRTDPERRKEMQEWLSENQG